MQKKKILVTGSAGYLGNALCSRLKQLGHQVIGVDRLKNANTDIVGNISDRNFVANCLEDGVDAIIHTAALHKPHIANHPNQDFIDTNITGTNNLLEEAVKKGIKKFIFTSTTSVFGQALVDKNVTWITEEVTPIPKNIYGLTKLAAEHLCRLFHDLHQLPIIILRTSRFFPEQDDMAHLIEQGDENTKANEFLYRRLDLRDVVEAHVIALERVGDKIQFDTFIISSPSPFKEEDRAVLRTDAPSVLFKYFPEYKEAYSKRGWTMFQKIDRIYVTEKASKVLGFTAKYDFAYHLNTDFKDIYSIPPREFPY